MTFGSARWIHVTALTVLFTPGLRAGVEANYTEALRLAAGKNYTAAGKILEQVVANDPLFSRAWIRLVEVRSKEQRLPELEESLAASSNPGACLGRMRLLLERKAPEAVFEGEARACSSRVPDSFSLYMWWIEGVAPERAAVLGAEFAARADASPQSAVLQFAASQNAAPDVVRSRLEHIDRTLLNAHNLNELDDDLYFEYPLSDPRRADSLRRLADRARASGDSEWLFKVDGRFAEVARDKRLYAEALRYAVEARKGALELGHNTSFYELTAGECLFRLGRTSEAIDMFHQTLTSAVHEGNPLRQAQTLGWLASQNNEIGNHTAAVDYALRSLAIAQPGKFTQTSAGAYIHLAFAWLALGQGLRALDSVREAESLLGAPVKDWYARILADAGNIYLQLGQPTQALAALDRSFSADPSNAVRQAESHLLRAEALVALHRPTEASQDLESSATMAPEISSYRARGQLTAGRIALDASHYESATTAFRQVLEAAPGFPVLLAKAHSGLSDVYWRQGRLGDALAERQRAIEAIERMRSSLAAEHRAGYLASRVQLYRDSSKLLLQLNRVEEAFDMAEQGRARELLDLTTSHDRPSPGVESADLQNLRAAKDRADTARNVAERRKADLELQAATDRYIISAGGTTPSATPLGLAQLQSRLGPTTAILHYTLSEPQSSLFVVTRGRVRHFALSSQTVLNAQVRQTRGLLTAPPERLRQAILLQRLRQMHALLIAPAAAELRGVRELVIVADGVLATLPFEALVEPGAAAELAATPFLLRRYLVRYAPSATLAAAPAAVPESAVLLAYGDPRGTAETAVERTLGTFGRLPFSRQEVEQVAALYPLSQRHVALADQTTESAFKKDPSLGDAGVVHLAVHGFVDDRWPQMSGLVLPEPPSDGDDGILRIYEILALRLRASLVVLSACDSGSGADVTGEGLSSLRRAFLAAGARSIVASSWRVNDRAAASLMVSFHRHLMARHQPEQALRSAQLEMLATATFAHPYYWSVFTLMSRGN